VRDVHDILQEHSVISKNIPEYTNKKVKNISAICGDLAAAMSGYTYAIAPMPHITQLQLAEIPFQSQSNCLNWYNFIYIIRRKGFGRIIEKPNRVHETRNSAVPRKFLMPGKSSLLIRGPAVEVMH